MAGLLMAVSRKTRPILSSCRAVHCLCELLERLCHLQLTRMILRLWRELDQKLRLLSRHWCEIDVLAQSALIHGGGRSGPCSGRERHSFNLCGVKVLGKSDICRFVSVSETELGCDPRHSVEGCVCLWLESVNFLDIRNVEILIPVISDLN